MSELSAGELIAFNAVMEGLCDPLSNAISENVGQDAVVEAPSIIQEPAAEIVKAPADTVFTTFSFPELSIDTGMLVLTIEDAAVIADMQTGGSGMSPPTELTDEQAEQLGGVMRGIIQGLGIAIGNQQNKTLGLGACSTTVGPVAIPESIVASGYALDIELPYRISDILESILHFYVTPDFARATVVESPDSYQETKPRGGGFNMPDLGGAMGQQSSTSFSPFPAFPPEVVQEALPTSLDLIMDIPLEVAVELGRVQMLIKDVLELSSGSIVELERAAGEPVDLLVNGRLVAKGEVVVIEDNFGIRVTEIISPADRLNSLGKR